MGDEFQDFTLAAVQAAPVYLDRDASIEKACRLIDEAAALGSDLAVFGETWVSGYASFAAWPNHPAFGSLLRRFILNGVEVPSPATDALCRAARRAGTDVVIGVAERDSATQGSIYCTLLFIGREGKLLGKHRKLKPTAAERLIWGEGDGSTLPVFDSPVGRVGGLICWENYMPLARMAMYGQGVEVYLAPTADARPRWQSTLQHIASEGRCFVLGCNQYVTRDMYPADLELEHELEAWPEVLCIGGSAIYGPSGDLLAGPLEGEAGILYADLDPDEIVRAKFDFDVTGHYARPDVFAFEVDTRPHPPVSFT